MTNVQAALRTIPSLAVGTLHVEHTHVFTGSGTGRVTVVGGVQFRHPNNRSVSTLSGRPKAVGKAAGSITTPWGSFTDFAHYGTALPDPAMILIRGSAAGLPTYDSTQPSGMRRLWVTAAGASDYKVSNGYLWRRSAYLGVGARINAMPAGTSQYLDGAQVEMSPLSRTGPSAYSPARTLQCNVRPTRLNFVVNPNFEGGVDGWVSGGSGACEIAPDSTSPFLGTQCGKVSFSPGGTLTATDKAWNYAFVQGVMGVPEDEALAYMRTPSVVTNHTLTTAVTGLIPGLQYTFSLYVKTSDRSYNVLPYSDGVVLSQADFNKAALSGDWRRLFVTYTATSTTHNVGVQMAQVSGDNVFWIDAALNEEGTTLQDYFDGSYGEDYLWEQGASANNGRSYYYRDRIARSYLLQRMLQDNSPLGVTPAVPQYANLPDGYTTLDAGTSSTSFGPTVIDGGAPNTTYSASPATDGGFPSP